MKKILVGFFVCFTVCGLGIAHASTIDSGAPFAGNSWDQAWYENGVSNSGPVESITQIQMEWISGSQFDTSGKPGILDFSSGSNWSQTLDTGTTLVADGNPFSGNLYFTTAFQDPQQGTSFYYQGYGVNNGVMTLVDSEIITWSATTGWVVTEVSYNGGLLDPPKSVPEPSCLLLLGGGLVGLAVFTKRSRKA